LNHDSATRDGQETAALYALGALSQQEARAFDDHLRQGCQVCSAELAQFDQVVDLLGTAAVPFTPPPYLRDLIAVRIEKEAPEASPSSGAVIRFPEKQTAVHRGQPRTRSGLSILLPWAAAATLLIALGYIFTSWRSERQSLRAALDAEKGRASQTAEQAFDLKEELARTSALSDELTHINAILTSPQWRIITMAGQAPAPDSSAKVYWDLQGSRWVVTATLPPAPQGKVYQLWFVTGSEKISAGLITPDKRGHGFSVLQFPPKAAQLEAAAITLEPEGGSAQPTSPIYTLGKAS
jgi:anti-sigma-K factor RskA